jgi:nucleotide-binding universal stress UspA family protein
MTTDNDSAHPEIPDGAPDSLEDAKVRAAGEAGAVDKSGKTNAENRGMVKSGPNPGEEKRIFLVVADNTPEMDKALRFAAGRAQRVGGLVGILRVIEPSDFQHWSAVGDLMRDEAREEAEQFLQECAAKISDIYDRFPMFFLREGETREQVLQLIEEEPSIRILILGASAGSKGPGPLITFLTKKVVGKMRVPVMLVPGGLTNEQIDELT